MISKVKKITLILLAFSPLCYLNASESQLKTMIRTFYPEHIRNSSVEVLMSYILEGTEYKIYSGANAPNDSYRILSQQPGYQKIGLLMSRIDAMLIAVGDENSIVVDHKNKLVSVTRNPIYEK